MRFLGPKGACYVSINGGIMQQKTVEETVIEGIVCILSLVAASIQGFEMSINVVGHDKRGF